MSLPRSKSYNEMLDLFVRKFELLDIPKFELVEIRYLIENKLIANFKDLLLHIMRKCRSVMPESIARSIGSHISQEDAGVINWDSFLQILEEEVSIKERLYNQMNFGTNKIMFERGADVCLSEKPREFFYHEYRVNFFAVIPENQGNKNYNVMIVNSSCLAITDHNFDHLIARIYLTRDLKDEVHDKKDATLSFAPKSTFALGLKEKKKVVKKIIKPDFEHLAGRYAKSMDDQAHREANYFDILSMAGFNKTNQQKPKKISKPIFQTESARSSFNQGVTSTFKQPQETQPNTAALETSTGRSSIRKSVLRFSENLEQVKPRKSITESRNNSVFNNDQNQDQKSVKEESVSSKRNSNSYINRQNPIEPSRRESQFNPKNKQRLEERVSITSTNNKRLLSPDPTPSQNPPPPSFRNLIPDSRRRMTALGPPKIGKEQMDKVRLESVISKSKEINEKVPSSRQAMHKLFKTFKSILGDSRDKSASMKKEEAYEDGDSMFEEIDPYTADHKEVMQMYKVRKGYARFKGNVKKFDKKAKQLWDDLNEVDEANREAWEKERPQEEEKKKRAVSLAAESRTRSFEIKMERNTQRRANMGGERNKKGGYERSPGADYGRVQNYKEWHEKPKSDAGFLTATSLFYWVPKNLIIVAFLTRELMSFRLEVRKDTFIRKIEQITLEDFAVEVSICVDAWDSSRSILILMVSYSSIEVYSFPSGGDPGVFLGGAYHRSNLLCRVKLTNHCSARLFRASFGVVDADKVVRVYSQTGMKSFAVSGWAPIDQKYRAVTVKSMDYSAALSLVVLGTTSGDVFLVDLDLRTVVFRAHKYRASVLDCKLSEVLRCFFVFWANGRFASFDLVTHTMVQEVALGEAPGARRTLWSYFPRIDEEVLETTGGKDVGEEEGKQVAARVLEERLGQARYSVYFGGSAFGRFVIRVDREVQFSEVVAKIKMMERQGMNWGRDSLFGHEIQKLMIQKVNKWIFFVAVEGEPAVLLVNDRKLLVYYNYAENLVVRYSLVELEGRIVRASLGVEKRDLVLCNETGRVVVYNLVHMHALKTIDLPLEKCIHVEFLFNEGYDVAYFHLPDEVFVTRATGKSVKSVFLSTENCKGVEALLMDSPMVSVMEEKGYLFCLLENFRVSVLMKKTMKVIRELDLLSTSLREVLLGGREEGRIEASEQVVGCVINNGGMYLELEGRWLAVVRINYSKLNELRVGVWKGPLKEFRWSPAPGNRGFFVMTAGEIHYYSNNMWREKTEDLYLVKDKKIEVEKSESHFSMSRSFLEGDSPGLKKKGGKVGGSPAETRKQEKSQKKKEEPKLEKETPPVFELEWSALTRKDLDCVKIEAIKVLPEETLVYLHPFQGPIEFFNVVQKRMKHSVDLYELITNNKTFDQKRLNETNILNIRNILRNENNKQKYGHMKRQFSNDFGHGFEG